MAYYRSVGEVPPKRHTQHRDPEGRLYYEELMGEEGFSSDSSLLYHRGVPSAITAAEPGSSRPDPDAQPSAQAAAPQAARPGDRQPDPVTGRRLVLGNNDVRIAYVVTGIDPSPYYRNAIGDECVYVESGTGTVETVFGVLAYRAGDYVIVPRATTHRWLPARAAASSTRSRRTATSRRRSGTCRASGSCSSTRRTASATSTARPAGHSSRASDVEVLVKHRTSAGIVRQPDDLRDAPVRRGRLGRLPLPLHVQRRGLHADHRQDPPAAAGAPGLRGPQLRGLQLPAAQGRLPRAVDPGALLPLQRRLATR